MTSEATPDTGTETTETVAVVETTTETETPDLQAELDKWKAQARKHEDRAKANAAAAKELEQVKQASMSDLEKAVAIARTEARTEALRESGARLVDAEVKAAAAGRGIDIAALLEGLDRTRFLTDDGEPDTDAIAAWVDRIVPPRDPNTIDFPDLGQGARADQTGLGSDKLFADLKRLVGG